MAASILTANTIQAVRLGVFVLIAMVVLRDIECIVPKITLNRVFHEKTTIYPLVFNLWHCLGIH